MANKYSPLYVLDWASNYYYLNFMTYPERFVAARLVAEPTVVIVNAYRTFFPSTVVAITRHGSGQYYEGSRAKLAPHFPYGHAVIDDRP